MPATNNCKNGGNNRDYNNNYIPYMNGNYTTTNHNKNNKNSNEYFNNNNNNTSSSKMTHVTAKVMWGSIGAIQDLREKEQAEKNNASRSGRRQ